MIPVELSEAADADLAEILSYGTEEFGEAQAEPMWRASPTRST